MCSGDGSTGLNNESSKLRKGNFFTKTLLLLLATILMVAADWKRKALAIRKSYQRNVLTLTQTMAVLVFLYINGVVTDYLLLPSENNSLFILEMLRVIFLENIAFKFLFPIFLIFRTQSSLPALWQRREMEHKKHFSMTKFNFVPRYPLLPPNTSFQHSSNSKHSQFSGISSETLQVLPEVDIV